MNNETTQLADYLGQMIRQATVETIRHIVGEVAASDAANSLRSIPLPGGDTEPADPEPDAPVWPSAPHVWWDGEVWTLGDDGRYRIPGDYWMKRHLDSLTSDIRDKARRFAREAVPVVAVPAAEWWAFRASAARRECHRSEAALIAAVDALAQEAAR